MDNTEFKIKKEEAESEISIFEICKSVLKKLWILLIVAALTASFAFVSAKGTVSHSYSSSFKNYFYTETQLVEAKDGSLVTVPNSVDAWGLVKLYNFIVVNDAILQKVADDVNLDLTPGDIRSMLSVERDSENTVVNVVVKGSDPDTVYAISQSLNKISTNEVIDKIRNSRVQALTAPTEPFVTTSGKNAVKSAVLSGAAVFFLGLIIISIYEIVMDKIKNPAQLERRFGIAVLGSVPESKQLSKRR